MVEYLVDIYPSLEKIHDLASDALSIIQGNTIVLGDFSINSVEKKIKAILYEIMKK